MELSDQGTKGTGGRRMQWPKDGAPVPSGWDRGAEPSMGMCHHRTEPPEQVCLTRPHQATLMAGRGGPKLQAGEGVTCNLRL